MPWLYRFTVNFFTPNLIPFDRSATFTQIVAVISLGFGVGGLLGAHRPATTLLFALPLILVLPWIMIVAAYTSAQGKK